ncbi:hypothetical protein Ahy_A07g032801 [Arachis hypogaea]|uniref:CCHC-type domain-containing protein n=1 Tax=Arachis hypogaea TaxID=3818 RepID=A0A445C7M6_ARAHY|nr:hypothetical protein Ahy_A07g032801 [Arachis hypogaea]
MMIQERFVVDLLAGSYSCRFWGLASMPCWHACSTIFIKGDNSEDYCSNYYTPASYLTCYETIQLMIDLDTIRPPIFKVKPGILRRVMIREHDEDRSQTKLRRRSGTTVTCSNCGQYGHNRRHCPNPNTTGNNPESESVTPQDSALAPALAKTFTASSATVSQKKKGKGTWQRRINIWKD